METIYLRHPVHTLDNRLLLPAGSQLTSEAVDALIEAQKGTTYQTLTIFEYGALYQDLLRVIRTPPYLAIFDAPHRELALGLMERVRFILPVLETLYYFKKQDFYTYRHNLIVFALSSVLALELLEDPLDRLDEALAGQVHDLGKICVPLAILKKTDPLTKTERAILEHHTLAGFVLLSFYLQDSQSLAARVNKEHHERRDGSGYPLGIQLRDRMVEIIAACDVYDALISPRPFRSSPYDNRTALEEITEMANRGQLSREVVQALIAFNRKDKPRYEECMVSTEKRGTPPADNLYGVIVDNDSPSSGARLD